MPQARDDVIVYIEDLFNRSSGAAQSKPTIFIVDDGLRSSNEKDYEPKIVSIGPIHHGKDGVKSMEQHKVRILQQLLNERDDLTLEKLAQEVGKTEEDARRCYPESINLDRGNFLGILLLDGCFIIQLLRNYSSGQSRDPIFGSEKLNQISHDLLLFENQLPFFVLTALFDMTKIGSNPDDNLRRLILFLVRDIVPWLDDSKTQLLPEPDHLLGLVYRCISTKIPPKPHGGNVKKSLVVPLNSASELNYIGKIYLERAGEDNIITFSGNVLTLPPLHVSGKIESLLRNLMAYEQLQLGDDHPHHVIDYVFFLRSLARSTQDIEILRHRGIIMHHLGGDDQILQMFDRLGTNFTKLSGYSYSDVSESLNRHVRFKLISWMATMQRIYFNRPGSVIKFFAATSLLVFVQTTFDVLSYFEKRNH